MALKTCTKCKQEKPMTTEYFNRCSTFEDGFQYWCKECKAKHHEKNKEEVNRKRREQWRRENPIEELPKGMKRCCICKEVKPTTEYAKLTSAKDGLKYYCKECRKKEYQENTDIYAKQREQYYKENKETITKQTTNYYINKYQNDIGFRILVTCRSRLNLALKGKYKVASTKELIGCSIEYLLKHLESQFKEGMTWDNYGEWHIDHTKPCSLFDFTKKEQQRECFNYKNLQPLWAEDNLRKSDKYEEALL